jgi:hypothetical protein
MSEGLTGWALARLNGGAGKNKLDSQPALAELQKRFGLDALGRELLALAWAVETSLEVSRRAGDFTVEVARQALGQPLDAALMQGAPLRRHALVTLDTAGPAAVRSKLRLGAGLAARLDGKPLDLDEFAPGVRVFRDPGDRFAVSARVTELIKDRQVTAEPLLATVDGCPRREALALGAGLARRFGRGLLAVDGEVFAGLREAWELLAALRREADCEGLVLLVLQSAALGEGWRALAAPAPAQPLRPPLVVLADGVRTREVTLADELRHQGLVFSAPASEKPPEPVKEDPYEVIRRQAQRDAEAAMGIYRAPPVAAAPPPPPPPPSPEPPRVEAKVEPPKVEPPKVEPPKVEPPKVEPPKVEAAPAEKPKKRRSKKAIEHFGDEPDPEPPKPAEAAAPPAPAPPAEAAPPEEGLNPDAPYLAVPEKPTPDVLAMIARTSKNPQQRLELLEELKQLKIPSVVAAMRDNARSTDPKIRALAETTMATFFGPNWNRTRPVAKPVQPPGSDDKNPNRPW